MKRHVTPTWVKPLIAAALIAPALASCTPQAEEMATMRRVNSGNVKPLTTPLPLEMVTHRDVTNEENGAVSRMHMVTFGNWMVSCSYQRSAGSSVFASCDVAPFSGEVLAGQPVPVPTMAVMQYRRQLDPVLAFVLFQPEIGTSWRYACGNRNWTGPDANTGKVSLDTRNSAAFASVMKTRDCEFEYVRNGENAPVIVRHLSNGFSEASTYAQRYVTSPN